MMMHAIYGPKRKHLLLLSESSIISSFRTIFKQKKVAKQEIDMYLNKGPKQEDIKKDPQSIEIKIYKIALQKVHSKFWDHRWPTSSFQ